MKINLSVLVFSLLICACDSNNSKSKLEGFWKLGYDGNDKMPFEFQYSNDSISLINLYSFKQKGLSKLVGDSLRILFPNNTSASFSFEIISKDEIRLNTTTYFRVEEASSDIMAYELLGVNTNKELEKVPNDYVTVHLLKVDDHPMVRLNDVLTDFSSIPSYLSGHKLPSGLVLFVGEGISFQNLIEFYHWIQISGVRVIILALSYQGSDKIYIQNDSIKFGPKLESMLQIGKSTPPSFPKHNEFKENKIIDTIRIRNRDDFSTLQLINNTSTYLVQIDPEIQIIDYLNLIELLETRENVTREIESIELR
jgi:hypothetical protein